ncbi:unnamed protein product [Calypogeia fissa]
MIGARRKSGTRGAAGELERLVLSLLRFDRLWWWLAVVAAVALLGQEIAKSSAFVVAEEFEGFGDELDDEVEDESDSPFVVPPPVQQKRGFQNDRGPPAASKSPSPTPPEHIQQQKWEEIDDEVEDVHEDIVEKPPRKIHSKEKRSAEPKVRLEQIWDEDEFEGLPVENVNENEHVVISGKEKLTPAAATRRPPPKPRGPQSYYIEAFSIAFIIAYGFVYYFGRKENEKLALSWAAHYAGKDSVMEKNFSLLGTGDGVDSPLLMKEGQNVFKFYASGRRYCEGLLATMDLKSRHDLITRLWYLISPRKDEITIDVFMNDENMDTFVFALARKKAAKALQKDIKDLNQFASILSTPSQRKWVTDDLLVISESRELANDLLTDALLDQVFGEKSFEKYASNFVSLHFTDQNPYGSHKKILQFKFTIPPSEHIAEMSRLISVVTYFIDAVGRYKLSPQTKSKADTARAKIAHETFKENQSARQEAILRKREERRKALEDAELSKLSPEGLRKREEKERSRQLKKNMPKVKMTRAH